jgi:hypothetical protein
MDHHELLRPHPSMGGMPAALGECAAHTLVSKTPFFLRLLRPQTARISAVMEPLAIRVGPDATDAIRVEVDAIHERPDAIEVEATVYHEEGDHEEGDAIEVEADGIEVEADVYHDEADAIAVEPYAIQAPLQVRKSPL